MFGAYNRLLQSRASAQPGLPIGDAKVAQYFGGDGGAAAGVAVTPRTAMENTAVWSCIHVLAETMGQVKLTLMEKIDNGKGRREAVDHPVYPLVTAQPNPWQTDVEWREMSENHVGLRGFALSEIVSNGSTGEITALVPLHPARVYPQEVAPGVVVWRHQPSRGPQRTLFSDDVLYIPGLSDDMFDPYTPVRFQREAIGLGLAQQKFGGAFYANNGMPKVFVTTENKVGPEAKQEFVADYERRHQGPENAWKFALLDMGMTPQVVGMSNEDAQFLQGRTFSAIEIASMYRVAPHKIGILDKANFNSLEQQDLEFVKDTMMPRFRKWEARLNLSLLGPEDRKRYFFRYEVKSLLRGDFKTRTEGYRVMWNMGTITVNEIRALEDLNPVDGGDVRYVPLNVVPAEMQMKVLLKDTSVAQRLIEGALGDIERETEAAEGDTAPSVLPFHSSQ